VLFALKILLIINYNDKKTLECEHMYHKNCINQVENNKCPLCNGLIINDTLKEFQELYLKTYQELESIKIENQELKDIINTDEILQEINENIEKSIKKNNYKKDIKNHYHIFKSLKPLNCNYCDFKTGKFGNLYNHMINYHYNKLNTSSARFTFGNPLTTPTTNNIFTTPFSSSTYANPNISNVRHFGNPFN
jgi:hypothetical protein